MILQTLKNIRLIICLIIPVFFSFDQEAMSAQGNKANGLKIYQDKCWWCHGAEGMGNGPASEFLSPKPRDFTWGLYKYISSEPGTIAIASDMDIFRAITNGLPGTSMPSWENELTESERWDLVTAVKSFTDLFEFEPPPENLNMGTPIPFTQNSVRAGRKAFEKAKCFECHGEKGRGDGKKKLKDDSGSRIWPRNLNKAWTFRVSNRPKAVFHRVSTGIPGTPMPSFFKALSIEERWNIANYVHSLNDITHSPLQKNTVLDAKYVSGVLPVENDDFLWSQTSSSFFRLAPNIIAGKRFFIPLNDGVKVKALFNDKEIVFLLEWADRTKSSLGDREMEDISDGTLYEDAVAIQFSANKDMSGGKPYLGHGDINRRVQIWHWKSGAVHGKQQVNYLYGQGTGKLMPPPSAPSDITAKGTYSEGLWKVMFRRALQNGIENAVQFSSGSYSPIAFANWDGSNGETGSRHTLSAWTYLYLEKKRSYDIPLISLLSGLTVFAAQYIIYLNIRRRDVDML